MEIRLILGMVGVALLILSIILCAVLDCRNPAWKIVQLIGEILAAVWWLPELLKFFCQ